MTSWRFQRRFRESCFELVHDFELAACCGHETCLVGCPCLHGGPLELSLELGHVEFSVVLFRSILSHSSPFRPLLSHTSLWTASGPLGSDILQPILREASSIRCRGITYDEKLLSFPSLHQIRDEVVVRKKYMRCMYFQENDMPALLVRNPRVCTISHRP